MESDETKVEERGKKRSFRERFIEPLVIPALALLTSLIIVAIVIIFTADTPVTGLKKLADGYWGIIEGALLRPTGLVNTLVATAPLVLTGLAVAIPFHAGLFNIGAEGQFMIGALLGALVGIYLDLPPVIHVFASLAAGIGGGMLWGAIPGILKAWLHSHEVINTIMLNFIAIALVNMVVRNFIKDPNPSTVQTLPLADSATYGRIPVPGVDSSRLHWGFFIALLVAFLSWYFLFKTTWGYSLRTTGFNPSAAEYAGIRPKRMYVLAMVLGGGMAGLAGIIEVQGLVVPVLPVNFAAGYGFDAIAVSLLAGNNPLAIIPAALIFGVLRVGGDFLQMRAGLSVHIVSIFRALILLFVAAPAIVRGIYRLKPEKEGAEIVPQTRWGE
ncbi:MAG: ABC transporter permease [Candidatus Promineifilaceae bacterium]|jgi:simple sugar transport system permease protein